MSIWVTILIGTLCVLFAFAALCLLLLALLHVRYRLAWHGTWGGTASEQDGSVRLEFGFPGFMHKWGWERSGTEAPPSPAPKNHSKPETPKTAVSATPVTATPAKPVKASAAESVPKPLPERAPFKTADPPPQPAAPLTDPNRYRKALFRLATDGPAWELLVRYGFRSVVRFYKLLGPRLEIAIGHPDPAFLGRTAGHWYAVSPLLPLGETIVGFRFQDRAPTLRVRAEGGFSGLTLLLFCVNSVVTFPLIGIGRRAWLGWRRREMTGWRAFAYRRIQAL